MTVGIIESSKNLYRCEKRARETWMPSRVVSKMLKSNRTIKDWILISLGEIAGRQFVPVNLKTLCNYLVENGFTSSVKPANIININLLRLVDDEFVVHVDEELSPRAYELTTAGLAHAMEVWFNELDFKSEWATEEVVGTAINNFPQVMHDALIDAGATEDVVKACEDPTHSKWLMAIIKEKYAPKS